MAVPAVGMVTALSFVGRCNGQRVLNTVHYRMAVAWSQATIQAYLAAFVNRIYIAGASDLTTPFLDCLSADYGLEKIRAQVIWPVRYRSYDFATALIGGQVGNSTAQNAAGVLTKKADLAGRSKIGSLHLGGLSQADYSAGLLTLGLKTRMATLGNALIQSVFDGANPGRNDPVIYHPGANANPKTDDIIEFFVQNEVRTQRTRTIGKGE